MNFDILFLMSMVLLMAAASSSLTACDRRNAPTPTTSSSTESSSETGQSTAQLPATSPSPSPLGGTAKRASGDSATVYVKPPYGAAAPVANGSDGINKPVVHGGVDQPPIVVPSASNANASGVVGSATGGTGFTASPEALLNGTPPAAGVQATATVGATQPLTEQERSFVLGALDAALSELRLSQLAADKASNSVVKSYAALLITDQGSLVDGLQKLAMQKGMASTPVWTQERQTMLDNLARATPESFDQAYLRVAGTTQNQALIVLFERADREIRDPALKAFVQSVLPALKAHLSASEQMPLLG